MAKKKAFGIPKLLSDGIGETINTANKNVGQLHYEIVSLSNIELDTENPRDLLIDKNDILSGLKSSDPNFLRKQEELAALESLAFSIKKAGVRNPIEVYRHHSKFILISGERRVLASLLAEKKDIPAKILDSKPDELQLRFLQWIENIERQDLTIWERLYNIEQLVNAYKTQNHFVNENMLSEIIGCSQKQSKRYLDVLVAPSDLKKILKESGISDLIKLSLISNTKDKALQLQLIEEATAGASRDEMSNAVKMAQRKNSFSTLKDKKGRGRPATSVSVNIPMQKIAALKIIVESVIDYNPAYHAHKTKFQTVNWLDASQIKKAFQSLIDVVNQ